MFLYDLCRNPAYDERRYVVFRCDLCYNKQRDCRTEGKLRGMMAEVSRGAAFLTPDMIEDGSCASSTALGVVAINT